MKINRLFTLVLFTGLVAGPGFRTTHAHSSVAAARPADWIAESNQAGARFGRAATTAGDVNGDGFDDVIVGANHYTNGQSNEGRAYVYLGSAAGLSTTPVWTAESDQVSAQFGYLVGPAGDVNRDGFDDVIVGAYLYDNGQIDEGRAYLYLGSPAGPSPMPDWIVEGDQDGARMGRMVRTAGDVNGDGFDDVIVGADSYTNGQLQEGRAYVYHGSPSGPSLTPDWTAESDNPVAGYGHSVSTAGDVNGDGYDDVAVGAYLFDGGQTDEGRAYVYHGSPSGLSPTPNWTDESDQALARYGHSASPAGNVNGDGFDDLVVGAYQYDNGQDNEGRAYLYLGSPSGVSLDPVWTVETNQVGAKLGLVVGTTGDLNRDGFDDVIVGSHLFDHPEVDEGRVFVFLGSAAGLSVRPNWAAESDQGKAWFGYHVDAAGDVNGDGFADFIVGANLYDNPEEDEGRAYVWYGSSR